MKNIFIYALIIINIWVLINYQVSEEKSLLAVEIKGAVKNPGVYYLKEHMNVDHLIQKAGGLKDDADISVTNLARELQNEDVVIIYNASEIEEMRKGTTTVKYIDKECSCPIIDNVSLFEEAITNIDGLIVDTGKISLNSATKEELMTLPGIGESKANLIIEYREKNNGFKTIEDIMEVKGIGQAMYEKIKNYLTL